MSLVAQPSQKIQREADYAMTQLKLVHPSRSELYMQTFYPETTKSLQVGGTGGSV
jgi:hypothetical protein